MPRIIGLVLVILGVVALSTGGFSYKKTETIAQIGDLKMRAEEHKQMAVPPWMSWVAIVLLDPPTGLRAVLERDDLVAALAADDLGLDGRLRDDGSADRRLIAIGDEQDSIERDVVAGLGLEQFDFELGADLDAVLLSAGLDDCVHGSSGLVSCDRARRPRHRT
jgi:hypothetical protein